jgi:hypothetical protein
MQCSKRHPDRTICGKRFCNRCILNRSVVSLSLITSLFLIDCDALRMATQVPRYSVCPR